MKVLNTTQQQALLEFLEELDTTTQDHETQAQAAYWRIELRPKRVRRKILSEPLTYAENVV